MSWLEENLILSNVLITGESDFDEKRMLKKYSTDQRFIRKRNTTYEIGTLAHIFVSYLCYTYLLINITNNCCFLFQVSKWMIALKTTLLWLWHFWKYYSNRTALFTLEIPCEFPRAKKFSDGTNNNSKVQTLSFVKVAKSQV